jgi:hypothetical protein
MIYAFNFTCGRDLELSELMRVTLVKYYPSDISIHSINTDTNPDYSGYGNGGGWPQGMLKVKYLRSMDFKDDDFVLSIDSDVVFCNSDVFRYIDPAYGIIGTQHQQPYNSEFGKFGHMSGAMILLRGDIARKIANLSEKETDKIRFGHFKPYSITENEDVILSYFAKYVGAESFDLGSVPGLSSGDFEADVSYNNLMYDDQFRPVHGQSLKSFYHLNYCPTQFMGEPVSGKWDIPKVLKQKGIEL